eukprot:gene1714-2374_t
MSSGRSPAWDAWDSADVRSVLESPRDLQVGPSVPRKEWESAQFEVLGGISALAAPLAGVPEEAVEQTRTLVEISLLVEGASAGATVAFTGATTWDLPRGSWSAVRPGAKRWLKQVKRWGEFMLGAIPPPSSGPRGATGSSMTVSSEDLAALVANAVAAALSAGGGGDSEGAAHGSSSRSQHSRAVRRVLKGAAREEKVWDDVQGGAREAPAAGVEIEGASGTAEDKEEDVMSAVGELEFVPIVQDEDGCDLEAPGDLPGPGWARLGFDNFVAT